MAVYTDVAAEELGRFLAGYDVGELLAYKGIAEGVENSNFLVHTGIGNFILTLYERRVAERDLPFFLSLMEHLASRGITCPQPVKTKAGKILGKLAGRPAAMVTFLDGLWIRRPTAAHCAALGEALARLHVAGGDFSMRRENALSVAGWRKLYEGCRERAHKVERNLETLVAAELDMLEHEWPHGLPQGVIHADLFPDNVFFLGEKLSGLIDFYFACTDTLAYDVAICLNAWCFETDHSYNVTKGRALLASYAKVRALSAEEWEKLPLLARGAALRFLLTRLVDWLDVPPGALVRPKDPREYARKLRFHQKIKTARDYGLRRKCYGRERGAARHRLYRRRLLAQIREPAVGPRSSFPAAHEKELKGGEPLSTNNRMELMAAISALEALKSRRPSICTPIASTCIAASRSTFTIGSGTAGGPPPKSR